MTDLTGRLPAEHRVALSSTLSSGNKTHKTQCKTSRRNFVSNATAAIMLGQSASQVQASCKTSAWGAGPTRSGRRGGGGGGGQGLKTPPCPVSCLGNKQSPPGGCCELSAVDTGFMAG